ncbi:MAG: hypothetical protein K1X56_11000 [Flavobacteriales bacterium]|nr:hypothetical protein [Flavobacteriales bacterium]
MKRNLYPYISPVLTWVELVFIVLVALSSASPSSSILFSDNAITTVAFSLGAAYLISLPFPPSDYLEKARQTFVISRLLMMISCASVICYFSGYRIYPMLVTLSATGLSLLPMKSSTTDRQKPLRGEMIRIALWLLFCAGEFVVYFSESNP